MKKLVMALFLAAPWSASALNVGFSPIVNSTTLIPGGTGTFVAFPTGSAISGGNLGFLGTGTGGQEGVYLVHPPNPVLPPSPILVADLFTPILAGIGNFTAFGTPSISFANVAFVGAGVGQEGVYLYPDSPIFPDSPIRIADLATSIPAGVGTFTSFSPTSVSIDGLEVAFVGSGEGQQGI